MGLQCGIGDLLGSVSGTPFMVFSINFNSCSCGSMCWLVACVCFFSVQVGLWDISSDSMAQEVAASWSLLEPYVISSQVSPRRDLLRETLDMSPIRVGDASSPSAVAEAASDAVAGSLEGRLRNLHRTLGRPSLVLSSDSERCTSGSSSDMAAPSLRLRSDSAFEAASRGGRSRSPHHARATITLPPTKWGRCGFLECRAPLRVRIGVSGHAFLGCSKYQPRNPASCTFTMAVPAGREEDLPRRVVRRASVDV